MHPSTPADAFDIEAWYAENEPLCRHEQHPAKVLLELLGKSWVYTRSLFPRGHANERRANGAFNGIKADHAVTSQQLIPKLEGHNEAGRRIYFVCNSGGDTWDAVANKAGGCQNHFAEFDQKHGFTIADAQNTDWSTVDGVGFHAPSALVFSGSFSAHLHYCVEEPYENPYRWFINQCRLAAVLGSDPACTDLSRVMRLPGFFNTHADGTKGRKSLLLYAKPERKSTIAEFEAALLKLEEAQGKHAFDCIPRGKTVDDKHRAGLISGFIEIFGEEIEEQFEAIFPQNKKLKKTAGTWSDFFDSRSREEIEAALELIPPFILGNSDNTYKGEAPVELADGREVHIDYFRVLAGLKAAWIQRRLDLEELIDLLADKWADCEREWLTDQINGANGSIRSNSFWHFARECGYQLTKDQKEGATKKGKGLTAVAEGESVIDAAQRDAQAIEELYGALFELASRPIGKGTRSQMTAIKSRLSLGYGVKLADVDLRLIEMISDKHGFSLSMENEVEREELTFAAGTDPTIPELIPYVANLGSDCVVIGRQGSGKTTFAATACDRVITGAPLAIASGPIRHTGKALYIATDGGEEARSILESYCVKSGIDVARHKAEGSWLIYAAHRERKQLSWAFCVRDIERLIQSLEEHKNTDKPIRLIVIDTLISVLEAGGINPGIGPVGACIRLMHEIASRYGATVMWLHHTTKDGLLAAGHGDITRVTNSNHYLELHKDKTDKHGRPVAELSTDKHRGREKRTINYVLDGREGIAKAVFDDPTVQHLDAILNELYEEHPKPVGPQILAENLEHLGISRKIARGTLSRARADHRWTDSNDDGKWFLTTAGMKEVERRREAAAKEQEEQAKRFESNFNLDSADELQSSVAA